MLQCRLVYKKNKNKNEEEKKSCTIVKNKVKNPETSLIKSSVCNSEALQTFGELNKFKKNEKCMNIRMDEQNVTTKETYLQHVLKAAAVGVSSVRFNSQSAGQ